MWKSAPPPGPYLPPVPPFRQEHWRRRAAVREVKEALDLMLGNDVRHFLWWLFWLGLFAAVKSWLF